MEVVVYARGNLEADALPFVGRQRESKEVRELLERGVSILTLLGPSGIGKTRLARFVAHDWSERERPDGGVWFCDLSAVRSRDAALSSIASQLGLSLSSGDDAEARLGRALDARGPLLLVLDNLEQVAEELAPLLARLVRAAPFAQILGTSVSRLHLPDEHCFELPPLRIEDAIELYEARALRAAVRLGDADRAVLAELVRKLDGLPLAIELAAARARILRPAQMLGRLDQRLELLYDQRRKDRHGSLESAIRWSWELLSEAEESALAQISIFEGGFTLDAAEAVVSLGGDDPPLLEVLEGLRDKSLLRMADDGRYSLLESVRLFASRRLADRPVVRARALRAHAEYFVSFDSGRVDNSYPHSLLSRIDADRANILTAHERMRQEAPGLSARAALLAAQVLALSGPPSSEAGLLDAAVQAARLSDEPALLSRTLRLRGVVRLRHGSPRLARADLDEALAIAETLGDPGVLAMALADQGRVLATGSDTEQAVEVLTRAVAEGERSGHPFVEGYAHNLLGTVFEVSGDLEESAEQFGAALELFRACGNRRFEGIALINLGVVRYGAGRSDEARELLERSAEIFEEIGDRALAVDCRVNLGSIELTLGRLAEAEALLLPALSVERELDNRRFEGLVLGNLGLIAQDRGELQLARNHLREALDVFREVGEQRFWAIFLPFLAAVKAQLGMEEEAAADFRAAREAIAGLGCAGTLATLELLEGFADLAAARQRVGEEAEALRARARARLEVKVEEGARSSERILARRLLERACNPASPGITPAEPASVPDGLHVGPDGAFFRRPGGDVVDLRRRRAMRRILGVLAQQRALAPGVGLPQERLFEAGWPDESAHPTAAAARVYAAIRSLRALGLEGILLRHAEGYLLDPALPLLRPPAP